MGISSQDKTNSNDSATVQLEDSSGDEKGVTANPLVVSSSADNDQVVREKRMLRAMEELVSQMRILNTHMMCVTDLEDVNDEPGDYPL